MLSSPVISLHFLKGKGLDMVYLLPFTVYHFFKPVPPALREACEMQKFVNAKVKDEVGEFSCKCY
jgi:hypothetical protein